MSAEWVARAAGGRLLRTGPDALGAEVDTRRPLEGKLFAALKGSRRDGHEFLEEAAAKGAAGFLAAEEKVGGLSLPEGPFVVAVEEPRKALAGIASAWRGLFSLPAAAVTGSFGKSTTKEILAALLGGRKKGVTASPASFNNDIGVPLTLLSLREESRALVAEVGSNAPGEVAFLSALVRPSVGIVTGVGPVHLEGLGSEEGVTREKASLLEGLPPDGTAVLDRESPWFEFLARKAPCRVLSVALEDPAADLAAEAVDAGPASLRIRAGGNTFSLPLPGRHNAKNLLLALGAFLAMGGDPAEGARNLAGFTPVPGRLSLRSLPSGIGVLDDTYNSNLPAAKAALEVLAAAPCRGRRIALLGEMLESGARGEELHEELGRAAAVADFLILVGGPVMEAARRGALRAGMEAGRVRLAPDASRAGKILAEVAEKGDLVLLKGSRAVRTEEALQSLLEGEEDGRAL